MDTFVDFRQKIRLLALQAQKQKSDVLPADLLSLTDAVRNASSSYGVKMIDNYEKSSHWKEIS